MNDAAWWARAVQPRAERDDLRPQRLWTLRKRVYGAAIDLRVWSALVRRSCSRWTAEWRTTRLFRSHEQADLVGATASDPTAGSAFGSAVAISGSTLIVGMQLNAHGKRSGAAYVFERRQGAWAEVTRLSSTGSAP